MDFLIKLGVPFIKIGSGDGNNLQLLEKAAQAKLPIVYSTGRRLLCTLDSLNIITMSGIQLLGMQDMETVSRAVSLMTSINPKICILQCTSSYPTPDDQVHLKVMQEYRDRFPGCPVGYSGHEDGLPVTLAAAALGAHVIERHITLDNKSKGNDHACSLEPSQLKYDDLLLFNIFLSNDTLFPTFTQAAGRRSEEDREGHGQSDETAAAVRGALPPETGQICRDRSTSACGCSTKPR